MKKNFFLIFAFIAIVGVIGIAAFCKKNNEVCFENKCFKVEVAWTQEEREQGLMFRKNLNLDEGMLFVFPAEGKHPFWMKNTLIPLDIVWVNKAWEVVFISKNTPVCGTENCSIIMPDKTAQYVLELNTGIAESIGLSIGNKINFTRQ